MGYFLSVYIIFVINFDEILLSIILYVLPSSWLSLQSIVSIIFLF